MVYIVLADVCQRQTYDAILEMSHHIVHVIVSLNKCAS